MKTKELMEILNEDYKQNKEYIDKLVTDSLKSKPKKRK